MFIDSTGKRVNIYAPYKVTVQVPVTHTDPDTGEQHTVLESQEQHYGDLTNPNLRAAYGIQEIPDPTPPADFSDDIYYRTEQDTVPYVVYTKKSDDQIKAVKNAKILAQISSLELTELMPRTLREFLLSQPGASAKPWYAKIKAADDAISALRAQLIP